MTTAIQEYSETEAALSELRDKYQATVWNVDTPDRMIAAKAARADIRKWRLDLEADRKRIKGPALKRCKKIDTEAKRITAELRLLEDPIDDAIKEVEQAAKREKERLEMEEQERVTRARAEIERIRNVPVDHVGAPVEDIETAANILKGVDLSELGEFSGVAMNAREEAVGKLRAMYAEAKAREEEQAKIEADRAELHRLQREQAERDRVECERREASDRERRRKLEADEKASRGRIAEQDRVARVAREKKEAESLAALEAEETRLRVERERIDAAKRKQEDAEREVERRRTALLDAREMLATFCSRYGQLDEFSEIAKVIAEYLARAAA